VIVIARVYRSVVPLEDDPECILVFLLRERIGLSCQVMIGQWDFGAEGCERPGLNSTASMA
jgi:hypothetical protein